MAFELKPGQGTLFKNQQKKADNHPDFRGEVNVGGSIMELAAWKKTSAKGTKYLSVSVKGKGANEGRREPPPADDLDW